MPKTRQRQTEEICFSRVVTGFALAPSGRHALVDLAGGEIFIDEFMFAAALLALCGLMVYNLLTPPSHHITSISTTQASSSGGTSGSRAPSGGTSGGGSTATSSPRPWAAVGGGTGTAAWWRVGARTGRSSCGMRGGERRPWRRCGEGCELVD